MKKLSKINIIWCGAVLAHMFFIWLLSYLYPITEDEMLPVTYNLVDYFYSYMHVTARIGALVGVMVLALGKWAFVILNGFIQPLIVLLIFAAVYVRRPDFNNLKDLPFFILTAFLTFFAAAQPDQTIIWISGACNYSWLMAAFLFYLVILRFSCGKTPLFKDNDRAAIFMFVFGIFIGMTNESLAPMGLVIILLYGAVSALQKRPLPKWYFWTLCGIILGLILLFAAPAYRQRVANSILITNAPLTQKLFNHLQFINLYIKFNLFLPVITFLILLLTGYDKFKTAMKNTDFILAAFFWGASLAMVGVFFIVPAPQERVAYPGAVFSIVSFCFALKFTAEAYKINPFKYLAAPAALAWLFLLLPLTYPYFNLHKQEGQRAQLIKEGIKKGGTIYLPRYYVLKGPSDNTTIYFYDAANRGHLMRRRYKLDLQGAGDMPGKAKTMHSVAPVI